MTEQLHTMPVAIPDSEQSGFCNWLLEASRQKISRIAAVTLLTMTTAGCGENAWHPNEPDPSPAQPQIMKFSYDPDIIQLKPPLLNPTEKQEKIHPMGIILHWWAIDANGDLNKFIDELKENKACGDTGCSSQYAVTDQGKIYRMMKSGVEYAYHAGVANGTTFGDEIEGGPDDFALEGKKFNVEKFESVVSLVAEQVSDFNLPVDAPLRPDCKNVAGIHGHHEPNNCIGHIGHKSDVGDEYTEAVKYVVTAMQKAEKPGDKTFTMDIETLRKHLRTFTADSPDATYASAG